MRFYVLDVEVGSSHETRFSAMEPDNCGRSEDRQACSVCGEHIGMLQWLPPYRAELTAYAKELGDVAFGAGNDLVLSARFRTAWEATSLRGLEFAPIEQLRVRPARLGKKRVTYYHVEPRRFGTRVDLARSLIEYCKPFTCNACMHEGADSVRGFAIDEISWTGEDMFYAWGLTGSIIVTDRVRKLRDDYGLTNVNLTPVEQYLWDPLYKWTPIDYSRDDVDVPDEDPDENNEAN